MTSEHDHEKRGDGPSEGEPGSLSELEVAYERLRKSEQSRNALITAAKDLLDTVPVPPTENGRRVFEALKQAIWDCTP